MQIFESVIEIIYIIEIIIILILSIMFVPSLIIRIKNLFSKKKIEPYVFDYVYFANQNKHKVPLPKTNKHFPKAESYYTLGLPYQASESDIKLAYRSLSKKYHPDKNPGNKIAEDRYKEITSAYSDLKKKLSGNPIIKEYDVNKDLRFFELSLRDLKIFNLFLKNGLKIFKGLPFLFNESIDSNRLAVESAFSALDSIKESEQVAKEKANILKKKNFFMKFNFLFSDYPFLMLLILSIIFPTILKPILGSDIYPIAYHIIPIYYGYSFIGALLYTLKRNMYYEKELNSRGIFRLFKDSLIF